MEPRNPVGRPQVLDENHARFLLRLPVDLFDDLSALAERRKQSLNTLISMTLSNAFGAATEHDAVVRERTQYRRRRAAERTAKTRRKTQR